MSAQIGPVIPGSAPFNAQATQELLIVLPARWFVRAWILAVAVHTICGTYLLAVARMYWFFTNPNMIYWFKFFGGANTSYFSISGNVFATFSAFHFAAALWILWNSLCERKLAFKRTSKRTTASKVKSLRLRAIQALENDRCGPFRFVFYAFNVLVHWFSLVFGQDGILSVRGPYFYEVFAVREAIEVISQTYQANRCTNLIPRPWINNFVIVLLVLNCWSTLLIKHILYRKPAWERLFCLVTDSVLDIVSSYLIPFAIFLPYCFAFDFTIYSFPYDLVFDALWYSRLVTEMHMVLTLSLLDLLSKSFNYFSILKTILTITSLLDRKHSSIAVQTAQVKDMKLSTSQRTRKMVRAQHFLHKCIDTLIFFWGIAIIVIYGRAVFKGNQPLSGCIYTTTPWFSSLYPCSLFNFNCVKNGIVSPNGSELDPIYPGTLSFLFIPTALRFKCPRVSSGSRT